MPRFLVIHGKGMENRGKTQIEIYGPITLAQYDEQIRSSAAALDVDVEIFHSNEEAEVIAKLRSVAQSGIDGALINPAGYTRGHPALTDALAQVPFPMVEVHVSNPARRGNASEVTKACRGSICGFGLHGYHLALLALKGVAAEK